MDMDSKLIEILNLKGLTGLLEYTKENEEAAQYITSILRPHLVHRELLNQRQVSISKRINNCPDELLDALEEYSVDIVVKKQNDGNDFLIKDFYAAYQTKIITFAKGHIYEKLREINPAFIEHQLTFGRNTRVKVFQDYYKKIATNHLLGLTVLILNEELNYSIYTFEKIVEAHEPSGSGLCSP